ncbi:MAG: elongation factor Ts [Flavobacteriales bacterium]|nr:elongation factor Ts [Flavobacteriales bacterium]
MAITASQVNKLRQKSGAGMMDCKKALVEADGDFEKAIDLLRKTGQKMAAKRGDKDAKEGLVLAKTNDDNTAGVILVLNCETDFVAKNENFVSFADEILNTAVANASKTAEELLASNVTGKDQSVADRITEEIGKNGEKIQVSEYQLIESPSVTAYNHPGNRIASIVALSNGGDFAEAGRDVAMQIAAMSPIAVNKEGVDQATIDREIEVGKEQARESGKPEEMLEKIAMGKLNKFFKESTLTEQAFIKDNKKSVGQYLDGIKSGLTVNSFKRMALD